MRRIRSVRLIPVLVLLLLSGGVFAQQDISSGLGAADREFAAAEYQRAATSYRQLIEEYPLSSSLSYMYFRLGLSLYRLEDYPGALRNLELARLRQPTPALEGEIVYNQALALDRLDRGDQALTLLRDLPGPAEVPTGESVAEANSGVTAGKPGGSAAGPSISIDLYRRAWNLRIEIASRIEGPETVLKELGAELSSRATDGGKPDPRLELLYIQGLRDLNLQAEVIDALTARLPLYSGDTEYRRLSFYLSEALYAKNPADPQLEKLYRGYIASAPASTSGTEADDITLQSYIRLFDIYRGRSGSDAGLLSLTAEAEKALGDRPAVLREFWERIVIDAYARGDLALVLEYLNKLSTIPPAQRGYVATYYQALLIAADTPQQAIEYIDSFYRNGGAGSPWLDLLKAEQYYRLKNYDRSIAVLQSIDGMDGSDTAAGEGAAGPEGGDDSEDGTPAALPPELYIQGRSLLAHAYYSSGRSDQALAAAGNLQLPALNYLRARIMADKGVYATALSQLEALQGGPAWNSSHDSEYLQYLLEAKRYARLFSYYQSLENPDPDSRYLNALALLQNGRLREGLDQLVKVSDILQSHRDTGELYYYSRYYIGWASYRLAEDDKAVAAYTDLLNSDYAPALHARAAYEGAWSAIRLGNYNKALDFINRLENLKTAGNGTANGTGVAAGSDADFAVEADYLKGKVLRLQGDSDAAARQFYDFWKAHPRNALADDALLDYAMLLVRKGDVQQGISSLGELIQSYPRSTLRPTAEYSLAKALYDSGEYGKARDAFGSFRKDYPSDSNADAALYYSALSSLELGEGGAARLYFRSLVEQFPDSYFMELTVLALGDLYFKDREYASAQSLYRNFLQTHPDAQSADRIKRSLADIDAVLSGRDTREAALWSRVNSDTAFNTQDSRSALLDLAELIIVSRGGISSDRDKLLDWLNQLAVTEADHPSDAAKALYYLGRASLQNADYASAARLFLRSAAADPRNADLAPESLYFAVEAYLKQGSSASAGAIADQLQQSYPDSSWNSEARLLLDTSGSGAAGRGGDQ